MKIAIVYDMLYPYNIGGVELRNYQFARRLVKMGHEVHLFGAKLWKGTNIIKKNNIYYHGVCNYRNLYDFKGKRTITEPINYSIQLYMALRKEDFDIIDCSAFPYFPCFSCWLAKNQAKLVITWHQYWDDYWFHYLGKLKGFFGYLIEKLVKKLTKNNIAVSEKTKKDLGLKNVEVITNAVDTNLIRNIKKSKLKSDIIYVGRLIEGKNVDTLIRATKLLKNKPKVIIVGGGPERKKLEDLSYKLRVDTHFLGFQEKKKLLSYLKSSKVFVFPSIVEGFGIVVIEAMACKLPCVVVKHKWNAATELIDNGKTGYIINNSESEIAHAVSKLLKSKNIRDKFGNNGFTIVKRKYNLDKNVKTLEKYYRSILKH